MNSADIESLLECSVCLERLSQEHKVLPCQHTFCLRCLGDIINRSKDSSYLCPECRTQFSTPLSKLPANILLNRLLDSLDSTPPSKNTNSSKTPLPSVLKIPGNVSTNPFISLAEGESCLLTPIQATPPPSFLPPPILSKQQTNQKHRVYRALYDYEPTKSDELRLKKSELYTVIDKCKDGWFKGSSISNFKTGFFPGNYVQLIKHDDDDSPEPLIDLGADSSSKVPPKDKYVVITDYPSSGEHELSLKKGDVLTMAWKREDGWCKGTLLKGSKTGLFPFSFVQKLPS